MKKIILTVFAATSLLLYSTPLFAFSISVGVPFSHSLTGKNSDGSEKKVKSVSGFFIQAGLPLLPGLGIDKYTTKAKDSVFEFETNMYNLFYLLPIPIVNLTFGLGMGTTELKCPAGTYSAQGIAADCSGIYDKGSASQWYASVGIPIIPLFDMHLSYRSVTAKNTKIKSTYCDVDCKGDAAGLDFSGNVMGFGIGFNF